jgi:hypothetical protein
MNGGRFGMERKRKIEGRGFTAIRFRGHYHSLNKMKERGWM